LRLAGEKAVVERSAGDAGVAQRRAVRPQVGAIGKPGQHRLDLRQYRRVVGVCTNEAQGLVQLYDGTCTAEPAACEHLQQSELGLRRLRAELEAAAYECGEWGRRHGRRC
jgi:hypothetical protein